VVPAKDRKTISLAIAALEIAEHKKSPPRKSEAGHFFLKLIS